jgi:hypothetical protein
VRKSGVLSRHIHPSWVTGYVIKGSWRYLEHDWVAREGAFVYEPPGEIHTLVVDDAAGDAPEMITFFNITGAMVYVDDAGNTTGYEDVFTKIAMCRRHYAAVGLGDGFVDQFVRSPRERQARSAREQGTSDRGFDLRRTPCDSVPDAGWFRQRPSSRRARPWPSVPSRP